MYWLQRPPYLRWVAVGLLIIGAAVWDLRPEPTSLHPFLLAPVAMGESVEAADLDWRPVPADMAPVPDLTRPIAAVDLPVGVPLLDVMLRGPITVPDNWWSVPVAVGATAGPGDRVLLVVIDPPTTVAGIVVTAQQGDPYSLDYRPASVAVPAEAAPLVAAASAQGTLVAAVQPAGGTHQGQ